MAMAMNPRPADMPSANVPDCANTSDAPLAPPSMPPNRRAPRRTRATRMPAACAASGASPMARRPSPGPCSIHPPPDRRNENVKGVGERWLREQRTARRREAQPVPEPEAERRSGWSAQRLPFRTRVRYNVPVRPMASSVTAVPAMIWSARTADGERRKHSSGRDASEHCSCELRPTSPRSLQRAHRTRRRE